MFGILSFKLANELLVLKTLLLSWPPQMSKFVECTADTWGVMIWLVHFQLNWSGALQIFSLCKCHQDSLVSVFHSQNGIVHNTASCAWLSSWVCKYPTLYQLQTWGAWNCTVHLAAQNRTSSVVPVPYLKSDSTYKKVQWMEFCCFCKIKTWVWETVDHMHNVAQELPEIDYYFTNPYPPMKSVGAHGSLF